MTEAVLVVAGVVLLGAFGVILPLVPSEVLVDGGVVCAFAGMLFGVPTGFWYHVKLRSCLLRSGPLPARWWLRPVALHDRIPEGERSAVLSWFYVGGAGFVATIAGSCVAFLGVLLEAFRIGVL